MPETEDLSFSNPSLAGEASRPHLSSGQPETRHPTEANSVSPGFTRINRKTSEEQEATTKYETPADSQKQSIDEELGIQDVTDINDDWYPPPKSELASSIQNLLDSQPMEVDDPPEERSYQMFDMEASDVLGPGTRTGLPCFSHARQCPRHSRRILQGSRGWKANHQNLRPAPPVVRSRDVPPKDRHPEEDRVAHMKNEE